jgi:response regulator RpfG family c-di-GMP phosphodiesterase
MLEKILMVDDESKVLAGYELLLHKEFQIDTAASGAAAVSALEASGPYAVVVSDMRMPEMDGAQLLARIKHLAPDTIRIMLTGNADIQDAVSAVNEGSIFRLLTKPCDKETLGKALSAGLMQYRLVTAEKELLENTLQGSIQVLTEMLGLVNPAAFGRALRVRRYMHDVVTYMALENPWRFEVAAMMSQLGCVALHPETVEAVHAGRPVSPGEQARFDSHPGIAHDLLAKIPRLEPIAWMIANQTESGAVSGDTANAETADLRLGANLLRAILEFDNQVAKGLSKKEASQQLSQEHKDFDPRIFLALREMKLDIEKAQSVVRTCNIDELAPFGMVPEQELRTKAGVLLVAKGQEVTSALILRLKSFEEYGTIGPTVSVIVTAAVKQAAATTA